MHKMTKEKLLDALHAMAYPDFVAFIGQINTPPGAQNTVKYWEKNSGIMDESIILDLACSTGFSSRCLVQYTGCNSYGIDISEKAIEIAKQEAAKLNCADKLKYHVGDATNINYQDGFFSHVIGGCNFSFIQKRENALCEVGRVLENKGRLCVSNFYYMIKPPDNVLDRVEQSISFRPLPVWTHTYWSDFFKTEFNLVVEEHVDLPVQTKEQIYNFAKSQIYIKSHALINYDGDIKSFCFDRLLSIRLVLNEHRKYQKYSRAVWWKK